MRVAVAAVAEDFAIVTALDSSGFAAVRGIVFGGGRAALLTRLGFAAGFFERACCASIFACSNSIARKSSLPAVAVTAPG
jgi:hypothetical protein